MSDQSDQSDVAPKPADPVPERPSWKLLTRSIPKFDRRDDLTEYLATLPDADVFDIYSEYKYLGNKLCEQDAERYGVLRAIHKYVWERRELYRLTFDKTDKAQRQARYDQIMRLRS